MRVLSGMQRIWQLCPPRQCIGRFYKAIMTNTIVLKNVKSKSDHDYSLQLNRWYLKPIGARPLTDASNVIGRLIVLLQNIICRGRPVQAERLLVERVDDREIMLQQAKLGRLIALISGIIMQGGTLLYSTAKAMKPVTIVVNNDRLTMYPMTCPSYRKFIDTRFSPTNEIMLVMQFMSTLVVNSSTVGVCTLAAVFATHIYGQLNVLYKRLDELDKEDERGNNTTKENMIDIVKHHLRILSDITHIYVRFSFITRMEKIFHGANLVEVMGSTMTMCLQGYYSIMNWANFDGAKIAAYVIVYVSQGFNLFIFCYIGEILTEQCKNVGQTAYMTNWYNLNKNTARGVILIIPRWNKLIRITAGKLFQLSIATFGNVSDVNTYNYYKNVLRTSIAYLNILRTLTT
ncbi:odorant receptor 4-like [Harpegnathos saltator]|uniref:odorant receptor 4-like n=1 Tax=Harpegnathos saltator TaxID=610380 RepID=UPI000DBEDE98|nr:odorant receptor 4-like [Harpegnathos saltator]